MRKILLLLITVASITSHAQITADIASLPSDWTRLTKMEDELAVYNTCDGGNLQLRLYKEGTKWLILAHGQQEDYLFEVKKATGTKKIIFDCVWDGTDEKQQFTFEWADKVKGLAKWEAKGWDWNFTFVSLWDEVNYLHIAQPCKECWEEEECAGLEEYYEPTDRIRAIFSNYVHYDESTDSKENKAAISKALDQLKGKKLSQNDLQLLINVWMYYDPTDFGEAAEKSRQLLQANKEEGIKAIKYRLGHPRGYEGPEVFPFSDLPELIKYLESKK